MPAGGYVDPSQKGAVRSLVMLWPRLRHAGYLVTCPRHVAAASHSSWYAGVPMRLARSHMCFARSRLSRRLWPTQRGSCRLHRRKRTVSNRARFVVQRSSAVAACILWGDSWWGFHQGRSCLLLAMKEAAAAQQAAESLAGLEPINS